MSGANYEDFGPNWPIPAALPGFAEPDFRPRPGVQIPAPNPCAQSLRPSPCRVSILPQFELSYYDGWSKNPLRVGCPPADAIGDVMAFRTATADTFLPRRRIGRSETALLVAGALACALRSEEHTSELQ